MKRFKQLLTAIQTFMDTEVELTEQAVLAYQRRPRIPYFLGGLVFGSWFAIVFMWVLNLYETGVIF